ncbi:hypothetical protein ABLG96_06775 [Nakamurella sp. A5-74]|uniref:DUF1648 domain-containing protein n=1 Tax=Nakamurella sp. A5-74 TaxID=3158264 RepID=A0AAU8DUQ4_9ACTN
MAWILGSFALLVTGWWITVTVLAARRALRTPQAELPAYLAHAEGIGTVARVVGVVLTLVVLLASPADSPTRSTSSSVAALIAAPIVIAVLVLGDRRWPAPTGTVRTASLATRRVRDAVPAAELVVTITATMILWVTPTLSGSTAGPNTSVSTRITTDALSLVAIGLAVVTIRRVTTRAALLGIDRDTDLAFRRMTDGRVLRTLAAALLVSTAGSVASLINTSPSAPGISGTCLLVAVVLSLLGLQGKVPRATEHATSAAAEPIS